MKWLVMMTAFCGVMRLADGVTRQVSSSFLSRESAALSQSGSAAAVDTAIIALGSPAPTNAVTTTKIPSILILEDGAIKKCPTGSLLPLETKKASMTELECGQVVQMSHASTNTTRCGNLFSVKIKPKGAPGSAVCACCPAVPQNDCVNCLAGAPSVGWQTRPETMKAKGWKVVKLAVEPPKQASCSTRAFASWAAMATYKDGMLTMPGGPMPRDLNFHYMMQTAFYKNTGSWSPTNGTETDLSNLWIRDGDCVIAFRGSDSLRDFGNNMDQSPISYMGLKGVFRGMKKEFEGIFAVMQMGNALSLIRNSCQKSITVAGHSLGGALSQLFAVLANKIGDPLNAGITVHRFYGFGALPIGLQEFVNDKDPSGCFSGGLYFNMQKDTSGTSFIDILSHQGTSNGYTWVKAPKVLTWDYADFKVVPCGKPMPAYQGLPPGTPIMSVPQLALHDAGQYVDNMRCKDNSGLEPKPPSPPKRSEVGVILSVNSTISQCPSGGSHALASGAIKPSSCAQLVREKKLLGVCGDIYAVKSGLSSPGHPALPKTASPPPDISCSCCSPAPVTSCVTCIAGSGNTGWETSPAVASKKGWSTMLLTDSPPKASTCDATAVGSWAAMAAYRAVPLMAVGLAYITNYEFMLKSAFWKPKAGWIATNSSGVENDYSELWVRESECIMAFRGADSKVDVKNYNMLGKGGARYHGVALNHGIRDEWKAMVAKLRQAKAFADIRLACPKLISVVGHSLGGAMAQMFALMANMVGDPEGMGLTVGNIFAFGAPPIGSVKGKEPVNGKTFNGCFGGGLYANGNDNGAGKTAIDPVFTLGTTAKHGYRHVKMAKVIVWSSSRKMTYKCGDLSYQTKFTAAKTVMPLNDAGLYTTNIGC